MKRIVVLVMTGLFLSFSMVSWGASKSPLRIGVLGDMTGVYSDVSGQGAVESAKMAVEAFGGKVAGRPIEVIYADHQNKADVASVTARKWFDVENVDVIVDLVNSACALAVSEVGREKNKAVIVSGAGTSDLTGQACSPTTVHWTYDTYSVAKASAYGIVQSGLKTWFFLTADYAFGAAMERDATKFIRAAGGTVIGEVKHPLNTTDFSSYLLTAQASGAQVIALANAGGDTANAVKQAAEFGITKRGQRLAGFLVTLTDVHAMGLDKGQGLIVSTPFYWDRNEKTRAYAKEFAKRNRRGYYPTMMQAGVYGGVFHYLKAVKALKGKSDDGRAVVAKMKELPTDDPLFGKGIIRKDGRTLHPMYVYQVKSPAESRYPWDYYKLLYTVQPNQAFRPMEEGGCPIAK